MTTKPTQREIDIATSAGLLAAPMQVALTLASYREEVIASVLGMVEAAGVGAELRWKLSTTIQEAFSPVYDGFPEDTLVLDVDEFEDTEPGSPFDRDEDWHHNPARHT